MDAVGKTIIVRGEPKPKGSTRAFVKGGRAITVGASRSTRAWEFSVRTAVQSQWDGPMLEGPISLVVEFCLPRPKSAPKSRLFPTVRPDLDKCARAVLDALTGVCYRDDSQIVWLHLAKKYADWSGAAIVIERMNGNA